MQPPRRRDAEIQRGAVAFADLVYNSCRMLGRKIFDVLIRAIAAMAAFSWIIWAYSHASLVGGGLAWGKRGAFLYVSRGQAMWITEQPPGGEAFEFTTSIICAEAPFNLQRIGAKARFVLHGRIL